MLSLFVSLCVQQVVDVSFRKTEELQGFLHIFFGDDALTVVKDTDGYLRILVKGDFTLADYFRDVLFYDDIIGHGRPAPIRMGLFDGHISDVFGNLADQLSVFILDIEKSVEPVIALMSYSKFAPLVSASI